MFSEILEDELDTRVLRSGRRFRSGKRRKVVGGRRASSFPREGEYVCESHLDEGSCDKEESIVQFLRKHNQISLQRCQG